MIYFGFVPDRNPYDEIVIYRNISPCRGKLIDGQCGYLIGRNAINWDILYEKRTLYAQEADIGLNDENFWVFYK